MAFMACHGVLPEEKVTPQKFIVDVKIETHRVIKAAETDAINDALNYVSIYEMTENIMMNQQYDLIETIAMKIATKIVAQHEFVICANVKVTKVNPPIEGYNGTVSCEYDAFGNGFERDFFDEHDKDELMYENQNRNIISFPRI